MRTNTAVLATIIFLAALSPLWMCHFDFARGPDQPPIARAPDRVSTAVPDEPAARIEDESPLPASTTRIGKIPDDLIARHLTIPVPGIKAHDLTPQFYDARGQRGHEAIDILAARGKPVVAVEDGRIAKLFVSERGGLTIYQFDPAEKYAYYYAHLDHYAGGVSEGDVVKRGQIIGFVGSTGNAGSRPHLHFAIFLLGPEKRWWKGEALDPYPALTRR